MKRIALLLAVAAAAIVTAAPQARPHHRTAARWYHLTLEQKRTVVVATIRRERQPLRWWIVHRPRFPQSASAPWVYCGAVGIHTPGEVCVHAVRLVQAIHVRERIDVKLAAIAEKRATAWLVVAFGCIHRYEGSWTSNTGNGYYGGLQMDLGFQRRYGADYLTKYGTADVWPIRLQIEAAIRAYESGRGFNPWPNTARACGLL